MAEAIEERHIVWFVVGESIESNSSRPISSSFETSIKALRSRDHQEQPWVYLIGKDGGIKHESQRLDLPLLFSLIDRMPMRQEEMLRQ